MSVPTINNSTKNKNLNILKNQYVDYLVDYLTALYRVGEISKSSYEHLIRLVYAKKIEQMIEQQIEAPLEQITVKINQDILEDAIASLLKKLSK